MKKLFSLVFVGAVLFLVVLPILWAAEGDGAGPGVKNSMQDVTAIEKTLRKEKIDVLEQRISDLEQANRFLTQRMQDLERTVYDFKSRT